MVFLFDATLTGRAYLLRDVLTFFHPWQHLVRESVRAGHLPLWNHESFCGVPLLANLQSGFFYPINWLYWLLPFDLALTWGMVAHLTVAGVTMRGFLRRVGVGSSGAFLGGALFAFGTWTLAHLEFPMKLGSAVWLPLLWSGIWDAEREGRRSGLARAGIATALSLFSGYPQLTFLGWISGSLLAATLAPGCWFAAPSAAARAHRLAALPVALALGLLAAAVQLLPASEMAAASSKAAAYDASVAMSRSLPPRQLLGVLDPFLFGLPGVDRYWGGETAEFAFGTFYVGAPGLVLAALAIARRRDAIVVFLGLGVVAGALLALGKHTPMYPFLHEHVPGFGRSRWPTTASYLIAVHLAPLAGIGLHEIVREERWRRRAALGAVGLGALSIAVALLARGPLGDALRSFQLAGAPVFQNDVYDRAHGAWTTALVVRGTLTLAAGAVAWFRLWGAPRFAASWIALILLDLFLTARAFETPARRGFYETVSPEVAAIADELGERRLFIPRSTDQLGNFLYGARNPTAFEWGREALLCNANLPAGIAQAHGCEPLNPRRHEAFVQVFDSERTPWEIKERIFDLWDAALLLEARSVRPLAIPGLRDARSGIELARHEPRLARASILTSWKALENERRVLDELLSPGHDPAEVTLIEAAAASLAPSSAEGSARAVPWENGPNSIRVRCPEGEGGVLRVLESFSPDWRATVNGEPAPIYRADFLFLAVPVPTGPCDVTFQYRPASLARGAWLSIFGLAAIGACAWPARRGVRREDR